MAQVSYSNCLDLQVSLGSGRPVVFTGNKLITVITKLTFSYINNS